MLNISHISIIEDVEKDDYSAFHKIKKLRFSRITAYWLIGILILFIVFLFVPWTQNIQSKGKVTTLSPEHRPQTIHSTIAGRIEKWYVQEGQFVKKGDTIVFLSETKADYFDPNLVENADLQVKAKSASIESYEQKVQAADNQIKALKEVLDLKNRQLTNKVQQSRLKITSDSLAYEAATTDYNIASNQFKRYEKLFADELISRTDFEKRQQKLQATKSKMIGSENKLLTSRNQLLNAQIELKSTRSDYENKIAKATSDRFSSLSSRLDAEASTSKLESQYNSYEVRSQFYYITAPQDCYIVKAVVPGIGETVKEGGKVVKIMPSEYQVAVEMYIAPMDYPLINVGQEVNFIFDGWPAFAFSGWSDWAIGTFRGEIVALDNVISENDKYRVLVVPNDPDKPWPDALRVGSGATAMALLNDVPLWYELWRQLNGFPPNFYEEERMFEEKPKMKAPIKSVK
ncbi:MAG: HlyD family secretion protein [Saprospiraceae bacterium]